MPTHRTHEAALDLPSGWTDSSINALEYKRPGGTLRIGVTRLDAGGKSLADLQEARLAEQRRKLPFFTVTARGERLVAGMPCLDVAASYREGEQTLHQRTASFLLGGRLIVMMASGTDALKDEVDAAFEQALATLTPRKRDEGA